MIFSGQPSRPSPWLCSKLTLAPDVFGRTEKRVLSDLIGHSKRVNAVVFLGGDMGATEADTERLLATASSDKLVKLWASTGSKAKCMVGR